jgi:DNA-binding CsgD family transcriptional regulator
MQIYDFTIPELERLKELCNFSPQELEYFNLRSKHKSNVEIALTMHVSEGQVSKLARKVKDKIKRTIKYL